MTTNKIVDKSAQLYNAVNATDTGLSLDRWLRDTFSNTSGIYDEAMDAARSATGHFGPDHRLFDGGHTLTAAWDKVKDALPNDTSSEQLKGYLSAIKNDVITPMGLPMSTLDKERFDKFVEMTGIDRSWAMDMASFTATEVVGAVTGALALSLNWNNDDVAAFSKTAGSLGVGAIAGANPFLGVISLSALAYKYQEGKVGIHDVTVDALKGATPTAAFVATAGIVGGPVWVGAMAGATACIVTANKLGDEDYDRAANFVKRKAEEVVSSMPLSKFASFKEASDYAKTRISAGAMITRAVDGDGFIVRLRNN